MNKYYTIYIYIYIYIYICVLRINRSYHQLNNSLSYLYFHYHPPSLIINIIIRHPFLLLLHPPLHHPHHPLQIIKITLQRLDIEMSPGCVYDKLSALENGMEVGHICGSTLPDEPSIYSTSNVIHVNFKTDGAVVRLASNSSTTINSYVLFIYIFVLDFIYIYIYISKILLYS